MYKPIICTPKYTLTEHLKYVMLPFANYQKKPIPETLHLHPQNMKCTHHRLSGATEAFKKKKFFSLALLYCGNRTS